MFDLYTEGLRMVVGGSGEIGLRGHSDSRDSAPILVFPDETDPSESKRTAPTLRPEQSFHSNLRKMTSGTRWPITPRPQCGGTELRDP